MEALSVSRTISESPSATSSPTATQISITSTPSEPPRSGTLNDLSADAAGDKTTAGASTNGAGSTTAAASTSISTIRSPSETLSPSTTFKLTIVPAMGVGKSIDALSVSTTIIESSTATVSPTATHNSITSTPSAPPISGTLIVSMATVFPQFNQSNALDMTTEHRLLSLTRSSDWLYPDRCQNL